MKETTIIRTKLFKLLWSKPISEIATEYDTDHQTIIGICSEYNIPRPQSGHWTKVRFGKKVATPALPESEQPDSNITLPGKKLALQLPKKTDVIRVKKKIGILHNLTQRIFDALKNKRTSRHDRLRSRGSSILDISVTSKHLNRAIRIIDAIVTEFEKNGYEVKTTSYNDLSKSFVLIDGEEMYFHIHEKGKRVKNPDQKYSWDEFRHFNTGELILGLSDTKYWSRTRSIADGKTQKLEDKIEKFFKTAFDMASKLKEERIEFNKRQNEANRIREEKERIQQLKLKIKKHREVRVQKEVDKRNELENQASNLFKSDQILTLIERVDDEIRKRKLNDVQKRKYQDWKCWADDQTKRLSPIHQIVSRLIHNNQSSN
ncbi:MAG: hypothetical protein JJ958_12155 [Balneola sp.]|nr:hypothetical protein [Balneola sp.]